jgi:hypothetical protein
MADWFQSRAPLNPEDAEYFRKIEAKAEENAAIPFQNEMARLGVVGQAKRMYERGGGPVDQEASLRSAVKLAGRAGATGGTPEMENGLKFLAYMASQPDSRNVYMQAAMIPEHAILHATEALSGEKSLAERGKRLAMAIPAAVIPELGYPIRPAYDHMYESLGPVGGTVVDHLMPDLNNGYSAMRAAQKFGLGATGAMRYGGGIPTSLVDSNGQVIRQLMSTPR